MQRSSSPKVNSWKTLLLDLHPALLPLRDPPRVHQHVVAEILHPIDVEADQPEEVAPVRPELLNALVALERPGVGIVRWCDPLDLGAHVLEHPLAIARVPGLVALLNQLDVAAIHRARLCHRAPTHRAREGGGGQAQHHHHQQRRAQARGVRQQADRRRPRHQPHVARAGHRGDRRRLRVAPAARRGADDQREARPTGRRPSARSRRSRAPGAATASASASPAAASSVRRRAPRPPAPKRSARRSPASRPTAMQSENAVRPSGGQRLRRAGLVVEEDRAPVGHRPLGQQHAERRRAQERQQRARGPRERAARRARPLRRGQARQRPRTATSVSDRRDGPRCGSGSTPAAAASAPPPAPVIAAEGERGVHRGEHPPPAAALDLDAHHVDRHVQHAVGQAHREQHRGQRADRRRQRGQRQPARVDDRSPSDRRRAPAAAGQRSARPAAGPPPGPPWRGTARGPAPRRWRPGRP